MAGYIHQNALAYSTLIFGYQLISSIFNFYYVKLFLNIYGISHYWFDIAQMIYLIWNAINDPLLAYWQDNSKIKVFHNRRLSILYGAPLFVFSFLLPWFPWGNYSDNKWLVGVHLFVSVACYDALLTFVLLAHCALYAEISPKHEDRLRLTKYSQVASLFASGSVMIAEFVCDGLENMRAFQMYVVLLALISWAAMHYTAKNVSISQELESQNVSISQELESQNIPLIAPKLETPTTKVTATLRQFKEIITGKNFVIFVTVNFLQIFHTYYLHNFLAIFADELIPSKTMPKFLRKLLYGGSNVLIPMLVLCMSPLVGKKGYYQVMLWSFYFKVGFGVLMFMAGRQYHWLIALFFLFDRSTPNAIFNFFNLAVSDIIDADQKEYKRRCPLSSSVFGYNALFTKPSQSLAPIMIVAILQSNNYQDKVAGDMSATEHEKLKSSLFLVACAIPVIVGLMQIIVWRLFSIRDSHKMANGKEI